MSFKPPAGTFQPDQIEKLAQVFDDVWETILAHGPAEADNDELQTAASEKLCRRSRWNDLGRLA